MTFHDNCYRWKVRQSKNAKSDRFKIQPHQTEMVYCPEHLIKQFIYIAIDTFVRNQEALGQHCTEKVATDKQGFGRHDKFWWRPSFKKLNTTLN